MGVLTVADWLPVGNFGGHMAEHLGLVVHVQQGDNSLFEWFNNPASVVSSHFWISKTGHLEQYVDTDLEAWAQAAGNAEYLSVETEGFDTEALTNQQLATLGQLYVMLANIYEWPPAVVDHGSRGMTTHAHYPSGNPDPAWGDHPCPGSLRAEQLWPLMTRVARSINWTPPAPPILGVEESMRIITCEGQPDLLWTGAKFVQLKTPAEVGAVRDGLGVELRPLNLPEYTAVVELLRA